MESDMQNPTEVAQLEMQQKLGRCMLRLQQYERLLKTMVANTTVESSLENLTAVLTKQAADTNTMTLGTLVRLFTRDYLIDGEQVVEATDTPLEDVEIAAKTPSVKDRSPMRALFIAELRVIV